VEARKAVAIEQPPPSPAPEPDQETEASLSEFAGLGLYDDVAVWVFITAFIGLAIAWSTGRVAPWIGALTGGVLAYLIGALVIALCGPPEPGVRNNGDAP
jgi:hypothetical protein